MRAKVSSGGVWCAELALVRVIRLCELSICFKNHYSSIRHDDVPLARLESVVSIEEGKKKRDGEQIATCLLASRHFAKDDNDKLLLSSMWATQKSENVTI